MKPEVLLPRRHSEQSEGALDRSRPCARSLAFAWDDSVENFS